MLRLRTFGGLSVENAVFIGGAAARRRPLAVLALLAVAGRRGVSRDKIIGLLWPESDEERARNSLSQALSTLRRELRAEDLTAGSVELRLNADVITSDVEEFERALAERSHERAVELYAGAFLDGVFIKDAPEFEEWASNERARLKRLQCESLRHLASDASLRGDRQAAIGFWRRLASEEPTDGPAAVGLMNALAAFGDRAGALRHYRVYEALVRDEHGCDPEPAVQAIAARLRTSLDESAPSGSERSPALRDAEAPPHAGVANAQPETALAPSAGRESRVLERYWPLSIAAVALTAAVVLGVNRFMPARGGRIDAKRVLVMPFDNLSGDSSLAPLARIAADWVSEGLARTALVHVVDPGTRLAAARNVPLASGRDSVSRIRALGDDAGAGLIVTGAYYRAGDSLYIRSRVVDSRSAEVLRVVETVPGNVIAPMPAVALLQSKVMGALASIIDPRLASVSAASSPPPNYEAYRAYMDGLEFFWRRQYQPANVQFAIARKLDSNFVLPLIWMTHSYSNLGDAARSDSVFKELAASRDKLAPAEQHGLDAMFARRRHDLQGEIDALRKAALLAPQSNWAFMLASALISVGRPREALQFLRAMDPYHGWVRGWKGYWQELTEAYHALGEDQTQLVVIREAEREFPEMVVLKGYELMTLASLGRANEVNQIVEVFLSAPIDQSQSGPGEAMQAAAIEYIAHGHAKLGRSMATRCARWTGWAAYPGGRLSTHADCSYLAGRLAEAESLYQEWARRAASSGTEADRLWRIRAVGRLGVLAAQRGDRREATRLSTMLDTLPVYGPLPGEIPFAQARIAIALGERDRAISLLQRGLSSGVVLGYSADHNVDYAPMRGYRPFEQLRRPTDEESSWGGLKRIATAVLH